MIKFNAQSVYYELKITASYSRLHDRIKLEILNNVKDYLSIIITELEDWKVIESALDTKYNALVKAMEKYAKYAIKNYHGDYYNEQWDKELEGQFESTWDDIMHGIGDVEYSKIA